MNDSSHPSIAAWRAAAEKELKGRSPDALTWQTPEGIPVKALYTAEDQGAWDATLSASSGTVLVRVTRTTA